MEIKRNLFATFRVKSKAKEDTMYSRILVPVDLEHVEKLEKTLNLAAWTAKETGASISFVGVVDAIPTTSAHTEGERTAERLKAFADEQAKKHGIETSDHVELRGDLHLNLGKDVIQAAKESDCDLIVMASHVPGLKEHFFASNAGYVASHAPMSVFVVR
jgi:nucleotide-binding universal stress UspA family protein